MSKDSWNVRKVTCKLRSEDESVGYVVWEWTEDGIEGKEKHICGVGRETT